MAFHWKDYILLAQELIEIAPEKEEYLRSAISRAYYGVFCIARSKKNIQGEGAGIHHDVQEKYSNSADIEDRIIGRTLASLRKQRNKADYSDEYSIDIDKAEELLGDAQKILKLLRK